ncbi:hypothetical protein HHK36_008081 [Tetracentron sinense]|uniref:VQ domain-containing protein n=1 Tax=Tetracentron sinense TaxID=13715 RepID=A0A834ZFR7_TETSI|nr:hypothetical protein HHK36_008081 [Tetracentron sinense]
MDSGHSGSMQSSSGGEEEYDSRAESISTFFNSSGHVGPMANPQPPPPPPPHNHPPSLFDPFSNYLDSFSRSPPPNPNSLPNLDMVWSRGLRSDPNCTEIGTLMGSSSSSQPISGRVPFPSSSSMQFQQIPENGARASAPSDQTNMVRNSKKRSRASRRAPTTVLTTDTSNFRAMVQEFTGIPAPPFSASPFPRTRLDLFSTASSGMRSGRLDHPAPPYLLRPFPQKLQPPSFVSSSSFSNFAKVDAIASTSNTTAVSATNTSNTTSSNNYQLPSDLGLSKQPQNVLNSQNPILSFQSLLQSPPPPSKYSYANVPLFGAKSIPQSDSHLKIGVLEEFGVSHGHVDAQLSRLPGLVPSDGLSLRNDNNPSSWGDGVGSNNGDQAHLKSNFNGKYGNSQRGMNYSASSSDPHGEKGSENVSSRGEGMVDSWICSSD